MVKRKPSIAIVGAGMGGLAAAATLRQVGLDVTVYEQAHQFARVGAGIQMLPNASRVLRGIGIEQRLRRIAFEPYSHLNRVWDTGEVKRELPMPESLFGAPFLCMHRADLHEALCSELPPETLHLDKKLVGLDRSGGCVRLSFADGTVAQADAVIGADGVHSRVRELIIGPDAPIHKGRIAYRAVFDTRLMNGGEVRPSRTKWWGPDRHIVIYYTTRDRSQLYFVTSVPEPADWLTRESWSAKGDVKELRAAYEGFHPEVRMVLEACPDCHKWAILEREPLPRWSDGRIALLGDACHPMTPYMAQGAATSLEDAAVLARCLAAVEFEDLEGAFRLYEANRKPRTSRIQAISSANTWMAGGNEDPSWLYAYDAWNVPLVEAAMDTGRADGTSEPTDIAGLAGGARDRGGFGIAPTRDGIRIAYRRTPSRAARPARVVLVHSLALDASVWDEVVPRLVDEAEVVAIDCRGHGRSERAAGPYTIERFGDDVADVLDHLEWRDAVVVGCSMGGCVAQAFAARHPSRTRGLVLIDTTAWYGPDAPVEWRKRAAAATAGGLAGRAAFQTTRWFGDRFRQEHPQRVGAVMDVFTANDLECYAATCAMLGDVDLRAELARFEFPVAVAVGEEDYATPIAAAESIRTSIAGASLDVLPGARHLTPIECPDAISAIIRTLIRRAGAGPSQAGS